MEVKHRDAEYIDHFLQSGTNQIRGRGGGIIFWAPGGFSRDVQFPILMAYIPVVLPYGLLL